MEETGGRRNRAETKAAVQREGLRWPRHLNNIVCEMEIAGSTAAAITSLSIFRATFPVFKEPDIFSFRVISTAEVAERFAICDLCVSMF